MKNKTNLIFLSLLLLSCGEAKVNPCFFIYDLNDNFMSSLKDEFSLALKEKGYEVTTYNASRKQSTQNTQIGKELELNPKNPLIINVVDRLSASMIIEKAEKEDTPVLFINREPLKEDCTKNSWAKENIYYVGADSTYQGEAQSEIASTYFGEASNFPSSRFDKNNDGKLQVALFRGELSHQDAENRSKYALEKLRALGFEVDLINVSYCDWEKSLAYEEMKKMYLNGENVELLLCNNDEMALGAVEYLKEKMEVNTPFIDQFFPILGVDGTETGKQAVKDGFLLGTVLNDAYNQAKILSDIYLNIVENTPLPIYGEEIKINDNFYYVKGTKITRNN